MDGARRMRAIALTALVAAIGVFYAVPSASAAITKAQANQIALQALGAQTAHGRVAVYTLGKALGPRDVVSQANPRQRKRVRFTRPGRARWFFWMDLLQDALFAHPSRAVTLDAATGRVLQRRNLSWYPLINGRKPVYLRSRAAYHSPKYQIYSNTRPLRVSLRAPAIAAAYRRGPIKIPKDRFKSDCLLTVGDQSPEFQGGYRAMRQVARDLGMTSHVAEGSVADLRTKVRELGKGRRKKRPRNPCKDIFIYMAGHGIPPPDVDPVSGGPAGTALTVTHDVEGNALVNESDIVRPADLESIIRANPKVTFKVKLMSCYGGRFIDEIEKGGRPPNLKVIETSSSAKRASFFDLPGVIVNGDFVTDPTDNPFGADEFTNANVHGLYAWATSDDTGPANDLVAGIVASFTLGANQDFGRNLPDGAQIPVDDAGNTEDLHRTDPQIRDYRETQPPALGLYIDGVWVNAGPGELQFRGRAVNRAGVMYRQSVSPITELRVVLPANRQVTNQLCPTQLPAPQVTTTTSTNDTLVCTGGSLPLNQDFTLNVRMSPAPTAGMGGQISGRQDGQLKGPFAISGP